MKKIFVAMIVCILPVVFIGCRSTESSVIPEQSIIVNSDGSNETSQTKTLPDSMPSESEGYEIIPVENQVEAMRDFFRTNGAELEEIAKAMLSKVAAIKTEIGGEVDGISTDKDGIYYFGLQSPGRQWITGTIEDEELTKKIASLFTEESSPIQYISACLKESAIVVDSDFCEFSVDSLAKTETGSLYQVSLIYCVEENAEAESGYIFLPINDHWQICVTYYE